MIYAFTKSKEKGPTTTQPTIPQMQLLKCVQNNCERQRRANESWAINWGPGTTSGKFMNLWA